GDGQITVGREIVFAAFRGSAVERIPFLAGLHGQITGSPANASHYRILDDQLSVSAGRGKSFLRCNTRATGKFLPNPLWRKARTVATGARREVPKINTKPCNQRAIRAMTDRARKIRYGTNS